MGGSGSISTILESDTASQRDILIRIIRSLGHSLNRMRISLFMIGCCLVLQI